MIRESAGYTVITDKIYKYLHEVLSHHIWFHVLLQISSTQSPIPVVCNVTAVHDLTEQITQISPRNLKKSTVENKLALQSYT